MHREGGSQLGLCITCYARDIRERRRLAQTGLRRGRSDFWAPGTWAKCEAGLEFFSI